MKDPYAKRVRSEGTPLIDGEKVTFVWKGKHAPLLTGDFSDWERGLPIELERAGRNTWHHTIELPGDAYIEYSFIDRNDPEKRYPDPYNKRLVYNGIGDYNNYFYMPNGSPSSFVQKTKGAQRGVVTRYSVDTWGLVNGKARSIYLYQPPVTEPSSLLLVWDGLDYLRRARLPVIVDNLIAQKRLRPVALAMVHNGAGARTAEYGCSEGTLAFILHKVLPLAQEHLLLIDVKAQPGSYGVMGASMGGLMALFTALRLPMIFGKVLSQSGAFNLGFHDTVVFDLAESFTPKSAKIWMDVGLYDFQILLAANRRIRRQLDEKKFQLSYREYPAGHNYTAWRNDLGYGLEWLFGR